jgi:hypothetical protein
MACQECVGLFSLFVLVDGDNDKRRGPSPANRIFSNFGKAATDGRTATNPMGLILHPEALRIGEKLLDSSGGGASQAFVGPELRMHS